MKRLELYILNFIRSAIRSQCRSFNSGVTWSYFLEHVTKRAAVFCTDCNFCSRLLGTPYSRELQKSNFEVTKAWTKISVVFTDRYLRIMAMLRKWWNAPLQVEFMWGAIERVESIVTPISLTDWEGWITSPLSQAFLDVGHSAGKTMMSSLHGKEIHSWVSSAYRWKVMLWRRRMSATGEV